jgi:hypothetical protein
VSEPKKPKKMKVAGPTRLRKVTAKAPKGVHAYKVRFGTRNEFGEIRSYPTAPKAKQAIVKELKSWKPWLERHNNAGMPAVEDALTATDSMVFHKTRDRIECQFDERYDMWLCAEYWLEE